MLKMNKLVNSFIVFILIIGIGAFFQKLQKEKNFEAVIPVTFSSAGLPVLDITIEGKLFPVEFDLGSALSLHLKERALNQIKKWQNGTKKWGGIDGICHESRTFIVPKIEIQNIVFSKFTVIELTSANENTGLVNGSSKKETILGSLGRESLKKYHLFLDFPNKKIIVCKSKRALINRGVFIDKYIKIPFVLDKEGILIEVETDLGIRKFTLDTGATLNVIKQEIVEHLGWRKNNANTLGVGQTEKFVINGNNFGKTNLVACEIKGFDKTEGVLGMDFLKAHSVFIDFSEKILYLNPNSAR